MKTKIKIIIKKKNVTLIFSIKTSKTNYLFLKPKIKLGLAQPAFYKNLVVSLVDEEARYQVIVFQKLAVLKMRKKNMVKKNYCLSLIFMRWLLLATKKTLRKNSR